MLVTYVFHLKGPSDRTLKNHVSKKSPVLAEDVPFLVKKRYFVHLKGPSNRKNRDVFLQYLKQYEGPPGAKSSDLRS